MCIQNNHARSSLLRSGRIFLVICCCLCLFLSACSPQSSKSDGNIFQYAIDLSGSTFSPKNVDFNMTIDEVLQATKTTEADIDKEQGEDNPRIIHTIAISGLSDSIREVFSFQDDKLVSVVYFITVSEAQLEKTLQTLDEQAAVMPEDLLQTEGSIQEGKATRWEDAQKNYVILSYATTNTPDERVIMLGIHMTIG